jgi:dihydrofolate synthase/folylpolyglutamate synthase
VVVGEYNDETAGVFKRVADGHQAPLSFADTLRVVVDWKIEKRELVTEVTTVHNNEKEVLQLDLTGIYQIRNLLTVLETVYQLRQKGWKLSATHIRKGLRQVKKLTGLHGRWETIAEHPTVVTDVAHNEDGIRQLARQIEVTDHEELHIIIGFVKDKDIGRILSLLPLHAIYYFTRAQIPRALPENELLAIAREVGLQGEAFPEVNLALTAAMAKAGKKDLVVVCGSVFVVGELTIHSTSS